MMYLMYLENLPDVPSEPSMLTVEGYLQGLGKLSSATGWRRWVARALAVLIVGPLVAGVVAAFAIATWSLIT